MNRKPWMSQGLSEWMKERDEEEFHKDLASIGALMFFAFGKASKLPLWRKQQLAMTFERKLSHRFDGHNNKPWPVLWDGRSWKWWRRIFDSLGIDPDNITFHERKKARK